jgi:hypothetical protein
MTISNGLGTPQNALRGVENTRGGQVGNLSQILHLQPDARIRLNELLEKLSVERWNAKALRFP